jgi:hypothetical protein
VIERKKLKEGTFSKGFLDGNESLSLGDKKFRVVILKKDRRRRNSRKNQ